MIIKNTLVALVITLLTLVSFQASAADKAWYFISAYCANCDTNGVEDYDGKPNNRLFISNAVYAGKNDHPCKGGAFYDKTNMNGMTSAGYSSESKAIRARDKQIGDARRDGYFIHAVSLQRYPDCD